MKRHRPVYFEEAGGFMETPVYDRYRLAPGNSIDGPAILEERESTLVIGLGEVATIDDSLNAVIGLGEA